MVCALLTGDAAEHVSFAMLAVGRRTDVVMNASQRKYGTWPAERAVFVTKVLSNPKESKSSALHTEL
jgi:hypothetical protein